MTSKNKTAGQNTAAADAVCFITVVIKHCYHRRDVLDGAHKSNIHLHVS